MIARDRYRGTARSDFLSETYLIAVDPLRARAKLATCTKGGAWMIRRFPWNLGTSVGPQIVSRYTRRSSRDVEDSGAFTVPSLAPAFAPAASLFIVHLSCFTPLKQQSPLTRGRDCWPARRPGPPLSSRLSILGTSKNRRFIYLFT